MDANINLEPSYITLNDININNESINYKEKYEELLKEYNEDYSNMSKQIDKYELKESFYLSQIDTYRLFIKVMLDKMENKQFTMEFEEYSELLESKLSIKTDYYPLSYTISLIE
jgi:L-arabinose isomerase